MSFDTALPDASYNCCGQSSIVADRVDPSDPDAVRSAVESARTLLELGLARLELLADVRNVPSHRVAESAGFVREGVLRSARVIKDARCDMALYPLVRADLEGAVPPDR